MTKVNKDLLVDKRYFSISDMFQPIIDQVQSGKGMERHGTEEDFIDQITWKIRHLSGFQFQMIKKGLEVDRLPTLEAQIHEQTGAIVYGIMELMRLEDLKEGMSKEDKNDKE